jgi:ribosomal protein S18 acetylase RimI-like enzyme
MTAGGHGTSIRDKTGKAYEMGLCGPEDSPVLLEMYDFLVSKAIHGLPPEKEKLRGEWVAGLLERGVNLLVLDGKLVVGHAAILAGPEKVDAEFMIFIRERHRGRGLGTALTRAAIEEARKMGLRHLWLMVEGVNMRAIGLYKKLGFTFIQGKGYDAKMGLALETAS